MEHGKLELCLLREMRPTIQTNLSIEMHWNHKRVHKIIILPKNLFIALILCTGGRLPIFIMLRPHWLLVYHFLRLRLSQF